MAGTSPAMTGMDRYQWPLALPPLRAGGSGGVGGPLILQILDAEGACPAALALLQGGEAAIGPAIGGLPAPRILNSGRRRVGGKRSDQHGQPGKDGAHTIVIASDIAADRRGYGRAAADIMSAARPRMGHNTLTSAGAAASRRAARNPTTAGPSCCPMCRRAPDSSGSGGRWRLCRPRYPGTVAGS